MWSHLHIQLILGSASVYDVEQTSIAIWGDDSSTPDIDGAEVR